MSVQTDSTTATKQPERLPTTKLVLIAQYELAGTITSLARVKILKSKSGAEALLVALKDAKLSLVEWDPQRYSISTISIHYYESEGLLGSPWDPDLSQCPNYLTVDPSSRCAALKFGTRHLAILPFHQVGDDLVMDDYDPEPEDEKPGQARAASEKAEPAQTETPYASSFVLSLLALDPALTHPIHLSFLYEYREPTFGILYSQGESCSSLLHERRDNVSYAVYTIDIEQRASTALLSVNKLPYDLHAIIPLSRVIGGVLLVGGNELIHVDQSGKTNGIAVNELAKQSSSFTMTDQSDLEMKLEHCVIRQLGADNTDLLMILSTGEMAMISFKIDGRSVSGLSVSRVSNEYGGGCLVAGASCASVIGRGRMFVGSEDGTPVILSWSKGTKSLKRRRSQTDLDSDEDQEAADPDAEELDDDDYDDLYSGDKLDGGVSQASESRSGQGVSEYNFRVHDSMLNVGPLNNVTFVSHSSSSQKSQDEGLEILATSGKGRGAGLTSFRSKIQPKWLDESDIPGASAVWTIKPKSSEEDDLEDFDRFLIVSLTADGNEMSKAYSVNGTQLEEVNDTDFDPEAGKTIEVGTLNEGSRMVQVLAGEVRTFDSGKSISFSHPFNPFSILVPVLEASSWTRYGIMAHYLCSAFILYRTLCPAEIKNAGCFGRSNSSQGRCLVRSADPGVVHVLKAPHSINDKSSSKHPI